MEGSTPLPNPSVHLRTGEVNDGASVPRTLAALYDTVQHLLASHSAVTHELQTKRNGVRTLVKERKAQHDALAKAQLALEDQRKEAEKQRRDFTKALRAQAKTALEDLKAELDTRHREACTRCLREAAQQHEADQQACMAQCVLRVRAQLMDFVQQLPSALHATLSTLTMPAVVEPTQQEREDFRTQQQQQQHLRALRAAQVYAAEGDTPYYNYPDNAGYTAYMWQHHQQQQPQPYYYEPYAAPSESANPTSVNSLNDADVAPDVKAECDHIAREVLGLAGGWSDLTSAAAAAATAAAATAASPPPPTYVDVLQRGQAPYGYGVAATDTVTTADEEAEPAPQLVDEMRTTHFTLSKPVVWPAAELAELQTVMGEYVQQFFATLGDAQSAVKGEVREGHDGHSDKPVVGPPAPALQTEVEPPEEEEEEVSLAMGLARWIRSLRQPKADGQTQTLPEGTKQRSSSTGTTVSVKVGKEGPLALLLNACVMHVVEHVLRDGVAHVTE